MEKSRKNNVPESKYPILDLTIPREIYDSWQKTVDLMAVMVGVPAGLVMHVHARTIEVFVKSTNPENVYEQGECADLDSGLYCETVMDTRNLLLVPNALQDPKWRNNPDIKLGMISYLGMPLIWPDGELFGTICVLDAEENAYTPQSIALLEQFRNVIQLNLKVLYDKQRLEYNQKLLSKSNQELKAFTSSVSHDLRAPLRKLDSFCQILVEDYMDKLPDEAVHCLERIQYSSRHMKQLIEDLLRLSRISREEITLEKFDISAVARTVVARLAEENPEREIAWEISPGLFATADRRLMEIALQNLLGNACKFTQHKTQAHIEFGLTTHQGRDAFFVRDNGAGFDMEYADKLFLPFQRLHSEEEFQGTGIGLATVQRIIHRLGGEIWAEAREGQGATFYFTLAAI